ncbi:MAG: hypothetical protein HUJ56_04150 [Erysipelotrichaceae bacterium]|nr:hypothetical protein [Erysipelotrichaceae bacterium]
MKKKEWIIYSGIVVIALVIGAMFCRYHADKLLIDDLLSISLSNTQGGWVGHEMLGYIDPNEFNLFAANVPFDYKNVWSNQINDCHPILYYSVVHTLWSIFSGKMDLWLGYLPNIVFFAINGCLIYYLSKKLKLSKGLSFATIAVYLLNPVILDHVAFIRMYTMTSMWSLLFAAVLSDFFTDNVSKKTYIGLFLVTICGGLTHYYCYIAFFFMSAFTCFYFMFKRLWKRFLVYAGSVFAGIGVALCIFPATITHLLSNEHSANAVNNLGGSDTFNRYLTQLKESPFGYGLLAVLVVIIVLVMINRKKINDTLIYLSVLVVSSVFYFLVVGMISTYVTPRYMMPMYAVLVVSFTMLLGVLIEQFSEKNIGYVVALLILVAGIPTLIMKDYKNPVGFAASNKDKIAIVYSLEHFDPNYMNTNAFELREYKQVYFTNNSEEAKLLEDEFYYETSVVMYVVKDDGMGESVDMKEEALNWLKWRSRFETLTYTGYSTTLYDIYIAE